MAIELGRVSTKDLADNSYKSLGIGINRRSDSNGIFATNYTTIRQTRDNLINLIMTRKGERVMQPDFGCDIHRLIFEPIYGEDIKDRVIDSIEDAVAMWMPFVSIDNVEFPFDDADIDNNKINVSIKFSLRINQNIKETIQITINQ
jgi:phage baseplate assembly protein W